MKPEETQTNYLYVFTALGHMLLASAQRWVDYECCRGVSSPVLTMRHQLAGTGLILPFDAWEYVM